MSVRGLLSLRKECIAFGMVGFFRWIPISCWSISTAPVRGGSHFLCCCKESNCIESQAMGRKESRFWGIPGCAIAHHGVELREEFSHACDEGDLGFFASGA